MSILPRAIHGARRPGAELEGADAGPAESFDVDVEVDLRSGRVAPSRPPPPRLPAISMLGRYEILGRVAYGGMAEIFLARETSRMGATRLLAIKRILPHVASDPNFVQMFFDEARLAIQLNHPNICHVYEFGEADGSYFLAMEWIHGVSLTKLIRRARASGGVPPEHAARIIASVADALHYAHRARDVNGVRMGIVHRDVSPQNVMINYDGQVKLLDFGIAKAQSHSTKTEAGTVKGKLAYMSPQQCLGKPLDGRADVFALGVCLFEALTGQSLFRRETEYETIRAIIDEPTPSLRERAPGMPAELDAIIRRAVMKDPAERYQSAAEMQADLERWIASSGTIVTAETLAGMLESLFPDQVLSGPSLEPAPLGHSASRKAQDSALAPSSVRDPSVAERSAIPLEPRAVVAERPAVVAERPAVSAEGPAVAATSADALSPPLPPPPEPAAPAATAVAPTRVEPRSPRRVLLGAGAASIALALLGWVAVQWVGALPASGSTGAAARASIAAPATETIGAPASAPTAPPISPAPPPTGAAAAIAASAPAIVAPPEIAPTEPAPTEIASAVLPPPPIDTTAAVATEPGAHGSSAPRPTARPIRSAATGQLSVNTRPWSQVFLNGRLLGSTPLAEIVVPAGDLRVRLVDESGRAHVRTVHVDPDGETRAFFELPQGGE